MGKISKALGLVLAGVGILVALLFICLVLLAGFPGQSSSESLSSLYHYELQISTTTPIEDAVLLIPIPARYDPETGTNVTPVDLSRASFSNFDRSDISVRIEDVDGIPMLNISADRLDPVYKNRIEPIGIMPGQNESELPEPTHIYSDRYSEETPVLINMEIYMLDTDPGHELETRSPAGVEPLFMPYRVVDNVSGSGGPVDDLFVSPGSTGHVFEVPFILSFDAADENVLTISSYFQGANQWWVLGWQSNSYHERVSHEFGGPCNGTYPVRGVLVTGEGVY